MPNLPLPLAAGIVSLPMLIWLGAAAAPILIHLWSRRKYREMRWAAMRRKTRRIQFEQLLLLIVRTLLIILLVLAVAEPYFERVSLAFGGGSRTHRMLVIDGSFSMGYRPGEKSRFERAKELAQRIVEESHQGDAFTLVMMASPPQAVVGTPALEHGDILKEIESLRRSDTTADLPATVQKAHEVLQNARRENPNLAHEIYFLTDLQRVGWDPNLSPAAMAEFQKRSQALAESATLVVIDLGQTDAENIAVTDLRTIEPIATLARSVQLEADLKNFGRDAESEQTVELLVDGRRVDRDTVDLAAGGEGTVGFAYRFETPGDHTVEVRADGDALPVDNRRFLAIPVRQSLRVLCINGRPSGQPFHGATDYLEYALAPQDEAAIRALVQADVATESALLEREPGNYDCIFLCDVAQFTTSEVRVLETYLQNGGNVVFFLGGSVLADRYNRELGDAGLLPARIGKIVSGKMATINPLGYRHPMVRAFRGREKAGLATTPIFKYFKLEVPKDSNAKVVLQTSLGDPLLVEKPVARGRVVLVATSADTSWTPAPILPAYVPLVQELLAFCVGGELQRQNVAVGEPLTASIPTQAHDTLVTVEMPDRSSRETVLRPDGGYSTMTFTDTSSSGIYAARFGPPIDRTENFAVNVNTVESDLTPLSLDELQSDVWPGVRFQYQTTWRNLDVQTAGSHIARQRHFHVDLLYAVLGLLFLESYLAWRFGHHTA